MDDKPFVLEPLRPHRKQTRLNKWFLGLAGVCAALFAGAYLFFMPKPQETPLADAPSRYQDGLKMGETRLDPVMGPDRVIVGSVRNETGKEQTNVRLEFRLHTRTAPDVAGIFASIPRIEAGGTAEFRAGPLAEEIFTFTLASIKAEN